MGTPMHEDNIMGKEENSQTTITGEFADNATIHGIPRVLKASNKCDKVLWIIICLAAMVMFIYFAQGLFVRFFDYPKTIDMEIERDGLQFPAITLCSIEGSHKIMAKWWTDTFGGSSSGNLHNNSFAPFVPYENGQKYIDLSVGLKKALQIFSSHPLKEKHLKT